jgi:CHASE2 domain-containing sensor protein
MNQNQNVKDLNELQQIMGEFKMIALAALVATAAIWTFVSMNLMWLAATYFGFLILISLLYFLIGSSSDAPDGSKRGDT